MKTNLHAVAYHEGILTSVSFSLGSQSRHITEL